MHTKEEKQPRSFTRRAFFTLLGALAAPLVILALSALCYLLIDRLHMSILEGWVRFIEYLLAPIALVLMGRCIYLAEKALSSGESRWKNVVMIVIAVIGMLLCLPGTMLSVGELFVSILP